MTRVVIFELWRIARVGRDRREVDLYPSCLQDFC